MPAGIEGNGALIESERTSELAYPATLVLYPLIAEERLAMPRGIEHPLPVNIPVSLRTRRHWFLIHSVLGEKLTMPGEMEHERTSEFA